MSDAHSPTLAGDPIGALEEAGPVCEHVEPCTASSVYAVPYPGFPARSRTVCPYHLGLYRENHPDHYRGLVDHPELADPDPWVPGDRFYRLEEAPEQIRAGDFHRVGVDHTGLAHYVGNPRDDAGETITTLTVDRSLDMVDCHGFPRGHISACDYLEHYAESRGWVEIDDRLTGPEWGDSA